MSSFGSNRLDPWLTNASVESTESAAVRAARVEIAKARARHRLWMEHFFAKFASVILAIIAAAAIIAAFFGPTVEQRTWGIGLLTAVVSYFLGFVAGHAWACSRKR